jgi:methyl-accepting chemotaxis protein
MQKKTLSFKLIAGGIIVVLIPLIIVGLFASLRASGALEEVAKERAAGGAAKLADLVQQALSIEIKVATGIAVSSDAVNATAGNTEAMDRKLTDAMGKIGKDYEVMFVTDAKGVIISDGSGGKTKGLDISERDYFKAAKAGKANVGSVVKSKSSGNPVIAIGAPITKDGIFVGMAAIILKIDYLSDKVTAKMGQTGYGFMTDSKGLIIAHPKKEFILELDLSKEAGMSEIMRKMLSKQAGAESYVFKGISKIAGFAPVELTGWSVCITQDADEFLAAARTIRNFILIAVIIFLALTVVAVTFFARSISKPIQSAVEEMKEAANQISSASDQVATASQSLAEGASEQASAIEETSSSLEEMSSMTKQNAGNAVQADGLMKEANQVVQKANATMASLTNSMREISVASEETSKIIKTIDEIAFQTNLLALNAAVEAARAGEAGAGFAVVAEEVRNLARRASDAAKNTSDLIEGTVKKIKDGSELVTKTNEAFAEVAVSASKVGGLVGEIAAASQEQAQGIDQINKAVAEMDKVTQSTAAAAEESASAAEEMNAQAAQMKQVSLALATIIGGSSSGAGQNSRAEDHSSVKKSLRKALPAIHAGKATGKSVVSHKTGGKTRPEQLIPMDDGDFKDF